MNLQGTARQLYFGWTAFETLRPKRGAAIAVSRTALSFVVHNARVGGRWSAVLTAWLACGEG